MQALEIFRAFHQGSSVVENPGEGYFAPLQQAMAREVRTGQDYELIYSLAEMYGEGRLTHMHLLDAAAVTITWRQLVLRSERVVIPLQLPEDRRVFLTLPQVEKEWLALPVVVDDHLGNALLNLCSYARTGGDLRQLGRVEQDRTAFRMADASLLAEARAQALEAAGAEEADAVEPPPALPDRAELRSMLEAFLREEDAQLQKLATALGGELAQALAQLRSRRRELDDAQQQLARIRAGEKETAGELAQVQAELQRELQQYHRTQRTLEKAGRQRNLLRMQNLRARPTGEDK